MDDAPDVTPAELRLVDEPRDGEPAITVRGLALDLDGTLLAPDGHVAEADRRAVRAAVEAGWHVVLATARWYQLAERTAHDLGLEDPVIACSGAEVRRLRDGTDLLDVRLPDGFAEALYARCDEVDATAMVYQHDDVLFRSPLPSPMAALDEVASVTSLAGAERRPRAALTFGDDLNTWIMDELAPAWEEEVRFLAAMAAPGVRALTLTGRGADKGLALAVACRDLGIEPADVVAFGDSEADVEMFRVAGASVAMGQASPDVHAAATWVTGTNAEAGVGRAIEALLDGSRPSRSGERR